MWESDKDHGFRFRDWKVYKDSRSFRNNVILVLKNFPVDEKYSLVDQTKRALNSMLLNIAEGSNKNTDKDTRVYINRTQGSLDEVVACLDCALDDGYIDEKQHESFLIESENIAKQLKKFSNYLAVKHPPSGDEINISLGVKD
jgi:four helix bundle protein